MIRPSSLKPTLSRALLVHDKPSRVPDEGYRYREAPSLPSHKLQFPACGFQAYDEKDQGLPRPNSSWGR